MLSITNYSQINRTQPSFKATMDISNLNGNEHRWRRIANNVESANSEATKDYKFVISNSTEEGEDEYGKICIYKGKENLINIEYDDPDTIHELTNMPNKEVANSLQALLDPAKKIAEINSAFNKYINVLKKNNIEFNEKLLQTYNGILEGRFLNEEFSNQPKIQQLVVNKGSLFAAQENIGTEADKIALENLEYII